MTKAAERAQGSLQVTHLVIFIHRFTLAVILEEHRWTSGRNVALREESLEEYRQL